MLGYLLFLVFILFSLCYSDSQCLLSGLDQHTFHWESHSSVMTRTELTPHYSTFHNETNCTLASYFKNPRLTRRKNVVLMIGDSLDSGSCMYFMSKMPSSHDAYKYPFVLAHFKHLANCSHSEHADVYFWYFRGGVTSGDGSRTLSFNADGGNHNFDKLEKALKDLKIVPTHIVFGSVAWDTQNAYKGACMKLTKDNPTIHLGSVACLCHEKLRRDNCTISRSEYFQWQPLPWCSNFYHDVWKRGFEEHVEILRRMFPTQKLYFRTQPPSPRIDMGTHYCQNYKNKWIRRLVASQRWSNTGLMDFDALLESVPQMCDDRMHYYKAEEEWNNLLVNTIIDSDV